MTKRDHGKMLRYMTENEINRCELCGSKRNLEVHHIIPIICGGDNESDNLIAICGNCHTRLTPKRILTRIGLWSEDGKTEVTKMRFHRFFKKIEEQNDGTLSASDVLDMVIELENEMIGE